MEKIELLRFGASKEDIEEINSTESILREMSVMRVRALRQAQKSGVIELIIRGNRITIPEGPFTIYFTRITTQDYYLDPKEIGFYTDILVQDTSGDFPSILGQILPQLPEFIRNCRDFGDDLPIKIFTSGNQRRAKTPVAQIIPVRGETPLVKINHSLLEPSYNLQ